MVALGGGSAEGVVGWGREGAGGEAEGGPGAEDLTEAFWADVGAARVETAATGPAVTGVAKTAARGSRGEAAREGTWAGAGPQEVWTAEKRAAGAGAEGSQEDRAEARVEAGFAVAAEAAVERGSAVGGADTEGGIWVETGGVVPGEGVQVVKMGRGDAEGRAATEARTGASRGSAEKAAAERAEEAKGTAGVAEVSSGAR